MAEGLTELAKKLEADKALRAEFQADPVSSLRRFAPVYTQDRVVYRIVVSILGLAVVGTVVGSILLSSTGKDTPQVLVALGSAAVGALAGLLAPPPRGG